MKKRIIKICIFALAFLGLFIGATNILKEKLYFSLHINSPETEIWDSFYKVPKDSLDVLFLGSSHVYNGINPVIFYEETGLKSFNMASSNQDMFMSYVYLNEALRYQTPEYVIMDAAMFNRGVFASEAYYDMSLNNMKWSKVKYDAIKTWKEYVPELKVQSRVLTIESYHSRWEDLGKEDFSKAGLSTNINGYIPCKYIKEVTKSEYDEYDPLWDLPPVTRQYFEKISNLCFERDINLVLILIPDSATRFGKTEPVKMLAWDYDLTCIDYNETENFERTGVDVRTDFKDVSHLNSFGATKFTKVLADDLKMYAGMYGKGDKDRNDPMWLEKKAAWDKVYAEHCLTKTWDMNKYLDMLIGSDYTIFVSVYDEGMASLNDELIDKLHSLGFKSDFANGAYNSFYGVIDDGKVLEDMGIRVLRNEGKLSNGKYWEISSASFSAADEAGVGPEALIKISGIDYSVGKRGLNFVVYDKRAGEVIDTICFDTYQETYDACRY